MTHRRRKLSDRVQVVIDEVLHALRQETIDNASAPRARTVQLSRLEERILMSASPAMMVAEAAGATNAPADGELDASSATATIEASVENESSTSNSPSATDDEFTTGLSNDESTTNFEDQFEQLDEMIDAALSLDESSVTPIDDLLAQVSINAAPESIGKLDTEAITSAIASGLEDAGLVEDLFSSLASDAAFVPESAMDVIESVLGDNPTSERSSLLSGPELVVIDYRVQDADTLLAELLSENRDVRLLRLTADDDGLVQITEKLRSLGTVSAIHLLTHGRDGEILLGSTRLNAASLSAHTAELSGWSGYLTADADLLIYGCDVAASATGQAFVEALHEITAADVAASADTTGGTSFGGDWDLEFVAGNVAAGPLFSSNVLQSWQHELPAGQTIVVTTTADVVDAGDLSSVSALLADAGADGKISLREALLAANRNADVDEIILDAGVYSITITGKDDKAAKGDFDILESVVIRGAGFDLTRIDARSVDRVFDVLGSSMLTVSDLTVTGGSANKGADDGGGFMIDTGASLVLNRVVVSGNAARRDGGGIANRGTLSMTDVSIAGNTAARSGGGLFNDGTATMDRVTFSANTAATGGGVLHSGSSLTVTNTTVSGNTATSSGGGLSLSGPASFVNVTIAMNTAASGGAGLHVTSGTTSIQNTLFSSNLLASNTSANVSGVVTSLGNNLSSDLSGNLTQASDLRGVDPKIEALAYNGGFSQTHALKQSSVAIDAGSSAGASAADQRNVARDGNVDIGAYEYRRAFLATSEAIVNTTIANNQQTSAETRGSQQAIARDQFGNYVIVWSSQNQDGSGYGVYARLFDSFGRPRSGEFRLNQTTSSDQLWARVVMDSAGNFVVTWTSDSQDGDSKGIYARRFDAAGTATGNEFRVNTTTTGDQKNSTIAMNASGEFVIAWQGDGVGDSTGVFFRRFSSTGTAIDTTEVRANTASSGIQIEPAVALDNNGNVVVAWEDGEHVYFQRFNSSAVAQGSRVQVDNPFSTSLRPAIIMDGEGNFTLVYRENAALTGIWGRGYNQDGTQRYAWFRPGTGDSSSPSIAMVSTGEYIVTYQKTGDGDGTGIFAQKYDNAGQKVGEEFQINQTSTGSQTQPSIVMLDSDNFVIAWTGEGPADTDGVFVRQFGTATAKVLTAQTDYATTPTNTTVTMNVLNNDSRPWSGDAIVLDVTSPANGTASLDSSGNVIYSPNSGFAGTDSLTYLLTDGTDGTTNYWGLNGNAVDSIGTMDGAIVNGPSVIQGSRGTALQFDEVNDYVSLGDVTYSNEFTLSFDFKVDDNTGSVYQYLYSHGDESAINSLNIILGEDSRPGYAKVMKTIFADTTDSFDLNALNFNAADVIGDGEWHTYTLSVTAAGGARVYIDGVLRASDTTRGGSAFNPTGSAILGARQDLEATRFFGGGLDSVRLFNRALTATEVGLLDAGLSPSASSTQATGTVYVTVQNAPPTAVANGPYSTFFGLPVTISAVGSSDLNGDLLSYEWDLNYDGNTFDADLTGQTSTATWAQLQSAGLGVGTHTVAVRVTDTRGGESIETATLTIQANAAPTDIRLSSVVIPGQVSGASIASVSGVDATPGDLLAYSVNDTRFEIVGGVLKLKSVVNIDRDTEPTVPVIITATDLAGNSFSKSFNLTVTNGPVVSRNDALTVTENAAVTVTGNGVLANDDRVANTVTSGAVLEYDASKDTDGDGLWEDSTGVAGLDYQIGTGVTQNLNPATNHHGILGSWVLDGTNFNALVSADSLASAPGNLTDGNVTFEFWFRPSTVGPQYMLFDSGSAQPGTGTSVRLNGTQLEFALYRNGVGAAVVSDISTQLAGGDFVQFAGTIRIVSGTATLEMFVNGVSVGTDSDSTFTIWSDAAEGTALGGVDGTVNVAGVDGGVPFAGELAIARFYGTALTSTQIQNNFLAVAGTSSGLTVSSANTSSAVGSVVVSSSGSYTYDPNGKFDSLAAGETATDSFTYTSIDGSGRTDTATVQVTITGVNDAPTVDAATSSLGTMIANEASSAISIASLTAGFNDVDHNAVKGIAITGISGAGAWEYSTDGNTWTAIGAVSGTQALLLDTTGQVRFSGTGVAAGSASLTYYAWDQTGSTSGRSGTKFDTTTTGVGGSAPFSSSTTSSSLTLDAYNFPPTGTADAYQTAEDTPLITTAASDWFNSAWNTRSRITLNNTASAALTNQVVLITVSSANIDYSRTQDAGQDLRFVDSDGTLLSYEIEEWNEAGTSKIWVRIPQIDGNSASDHIWMYYGNSEAMDAQNSSAVWAGQAVVLHMDGTVTDSSPFATGVLATSASPVTGISSGAQQFDGSNTSVRMNSSSQLDDLFVGGGTISAWINPASWGENGFGRIADKASTTFAGGLLGNGWALQVAANGRLIFEQGFTVTTGEWITASGVINLNQWQHVVVTYDSSNGGVAPKIYINGVAVAVSTNAAPIGVLLSDSGQQLTIGNHAAASTRTFDGGIDEFRATDSVLSASQILADYRSVAGTMTTVGTAEVGPGGVLTNDRDPEQQPLRATLNSGPTHATSFTLNSDGSFTYVPVADWFGTDSFTYTVSDGEKSDGPITVNIVVTPVNDAPSSITLSNGSFADKTDGAVVGTITVTDIDAGDTHTLSVSDNRFEIVGSVLHLKAGTSVDASLEPSVTLTIQATDASGGIFNQTVVLNVDTINLAPSAQIGGPYTIAEGDPVTLSAAGTSDPENTTLSYAWDLDGDGAYNDAFGQTVSLTWAQLNSLTVPINDDGTRNISVLVTDAGGLSASAATTLTVTNTAPTVNVSGPATATSGTPYTLNLSSSDPGHDTITTWRIQWGDGQIEDVSGAVTTISHTYQRPGGTRTIRVFAIDDDGTHAATSGPLTISVANSAPSALTLSSATIDGNRNGAVVGNFAFSDPDFGDSHAISVSDARFVVVGGILKLASGQSINSAVESVVNLSISVSDSTGALTTSGFTIGVNAPPVANADAYAVDGTQQLNVASPSIGVLANDVDPDGPSTQAVLTTGPSHSQAFGLNADGTFWYRASAGYSGADSFSYRVFDGRVYSEVVTVSLIVNQPGSLSFTQTASSIDENVTLTAPMKIGQFMISDDGIGTNTITLTGAAATYFELDGQHNLYLKRGVSLDYEAISTLTVTANLDDSAIGGSPDDSSSVTVLVNNRNDAPVAANVGSSSFQEDFGTATIHAGTAFSDQDGDALTFQMQIISQTSGLLNALTIDSATGALTLSSAANQFGNVVVDVTATDLTGASATARYSIVVNSVNDAPVALDYSGTTLGGQALRGSSLLTGSSDIEGSPLQIVLISGPANGTVSINADGTFLYTPNTGFLGNDSFRFAASDGTSLSSTRVATIAVQAPLLNSGSGSASSSATAAVSTTNSETTTADSGTTTSSSSASGSQTSGTTNSGTNNSPTSLAPNPAGAAGQLESVLEDEKDADRGNEGLEASLVGQFLTTVVSTNSTGDRSGLPSTTIAYEHSRRDFDISTQTFQLNSPLGLFASGGQTVTMQQRELLYRTLIDQNIQSVTEFEEDIGRKFSISDQVVGSVEVVTTVSSVGYLIWNAVRGGMLLSSLMAQIPAWNMLDPLLVIDGDTKEEDKESLQNIMDQQQKKLKRQASDKE